MSRVTVSPQVLWWALNRSGVDVERLHKKLPVSKWLSGEAEPTLKQLESFSVSTRTPFGYLFLSEPPEEVLPIRFFRTLGDEALGEASPDFIRDGTDGYDASGVDA